MDQSSLFHLAIALLYALVFAEASLSKLIAREVPQWFVDQFKDTWLGRFPSAPQYWLIALLELAVFALVVVSVVTGEPWETGQNMYLGYALLLASAVFSLLCFGLRVSFDFAGAASAFAYSALTLILWAVIAFSPTF
jgi:hypothetical protein